jgi:hypothetical protein
VSVNHIVWSKDRFLSWDDFQGEVNYSLPSWQHALSTTEVYAKPHFEPIQKSTKIKLEIVSITAEAVFIPSDSWVKDNYKMPKLLKHEQGHFDIAELTAREISTKLQTLQDKSITTPYSDIEIANKDPNGIMKKFIQNKIADAKKNTTYSHEKYDKDTKHGTIAEVQNQYDKEFEKLRE